MIRRRRWLSFSLVVAIGIFLGSHAVQAGDRSMKEHMEIQAKITKDPGLGSLPSIQIDTMQANVPLDDRMNAEEAFNRPFTDSLKEAMVWYLDQRGLKVTDQGADLRLAGTIESYEGFKGWGHWGVDVQLKVKCFRGSQVAYSEVLRSFLKYSNDDDVVNEEEPKYEARHATVRFPEVLFTRVGIDLSEKIISFLKEKGTAGVGSRELPPPEVAPARGKLTIDATVAHAEVLLDGKLVGTTPLENLVLPATTHAIEIRKQGFKPWKREVAVLEGATSRITAEMEADREK